LCHTWLKIGPAAVVYCVPLGSHPNVRISLHHCARDVPCKCHHSRVRGLRFRKARDEGVTYIMKTARNASGLACAFPSHFPTVRRFGGDDLIRARLAIISGKAILLMRDYMVLLLYAEVAVAIPYLLVWKSRQTDEIQEAVRVSICVPLHSGEMIWSKRSGRKYSSGLLYSATHTQKRQASFAILLLALRKAAPVAIRLGSWRPVY